MKPDSRPCQKCSKPIIGSTGAGHTVRTESGLIVGYRLPAPQMGYECTQCHGGQDVKVAACGKD